MPSLFEIGPVVRNKIFKVPQCIFAISFYLLLEKGLVLYSNELEFPSSKDALCQVWLIFGPMVLKKIFIVCQCIFAISLLSPLGKGQGPSFEQT